MTSSRASGPIVRLRNAIDVLHREGIKFGVVGALAFVVDLGSFNILRATVLAGKPTTAVILSAAIATVFAWLGNRLWTFRHRRSRPVGEEAALFAATNGIALILQAGAVAMANYVLGLDSLTSDNIAKVLGIGLGTVFRFWVYRSVVFAGRPASTTPPPTRSSRK